MAISLAVELLEAGALDVVVDPALTLEDAGMLPLLLDDCEPAPWLFETPALADDEPASWLATKVEVLLLPPSVGYALELELELVTGTAVV